MPAAKVDESELVKLELSTTAAERASELTGTAAASRILPKYPKASYGNAGVPTNLRGCGTDRLWTGHTRGETVQRTMQESPYPR